LKKNATRPTTSASSSDLPLDLRSITGYQRTISRAENLIV